MNMNSNKQDFVRAIPNDVSKLRLLAHKSEAHWGYNENFMDIFDQVFNITEQFIRRNPVFVLWSDTDPVAFWGLMKDDVCWELEYFYVEVSSLGKGYGKQMWSHMINWCEEHKIQTIHFVTSTQAVGFYERMGATKDYMAQSVIDGRSIPHFTYEVVETRRMLSE